MSIDVQIQQPTLTVRPGESGRLKFTVTNVGDAALPVVAQVVGSADGAPPLPVGSADVDRPGRTIGAGAMDEFVVVVEPPLETSPATYGFVLHVASSSTDAVQVWGQSPQVAVTIPAVEIPKPPWWPKWLMVAAAVLIGLAVGALAFRLVDGDDGWQVQQAFEEPVVLTPGESIVIGVSEDITEQRLTFVGGVGELERFTVTDAPVAATSSVVDDAAGDACLDALEVAPDQTEVALPIDGRSVCTFIGPGQVGVIGIQSLEFDRVTVTMDVWTTG